MNATTKINKKTDISKYFGSLKFKRDALEIQKEMRDEWLSVFQKSMEGEAKKAGFKSEEDVTLYIKALRKSSNY